MTARAEADISAARRYIHRRGTIRRSRSVVDYRTEPIVDSLCADLCTRYTKHTRRDINVTDMDAQVDVIDI